MATPKRTVKGQSRAEIMASAKVLQDAIILALAGQEPRKFIPIMKAVGCDDRFRMERAIDRLIMERKVVSTRKLGGTTYELAKQVDGLVALYCPPVKKPPGRVRHVKARHVKVERVALPPMLGYTSGMDGAL